MPATLAAAAAQTARNAMQHGLAASLGTVGATQVRFLYGFPFALCFLALVVLGSGMPPPAADGRFLAYTLAGAVAQILATALMLAAMRLRNFAIATAYTKTEPLQVVLFEVAVLAAALSAVTAAATAVATAGVVLLSWKRGPPDAGGFAPALMGMAAGALFAVAAVGFRGGIMALPEGSFVLRASTTLAWSLGLQTAILLAWLALFDRNALVGSARVWRSSFGAGFLGALASQFWFIGFALTAAANVRTLGLVEVLFAAVVSRRLFAERLARREAIGLAMVVAGVALLLTSTQAVAH